MNEYTDPTVHLPLDARAAAPGGRPRPVAHPVPGPRTGGLLPVAPVAGPAVHPMSSVPPGSPPGRRPPFPGPPGPPHPSPPSGRPGPAVPPGRPGPVGPWGQAAGEGTGRVPGPPPATPPTGSGGDRPGRPGGPRRRRVALLTAATALVAVLAVVVLLLTGALRPGAPAAPALAPGPLPTERVTPYADMTAFTPPDLAAYARDTGQREIVLAFVLAGREGCDRPAWGGTVALGDPKVMDRVNALRVAGGSVSVATGGARAPYLETACTDAASLVRAYRTTLDAVGSNHLDVDLEAPVDSGMVADALAQLQRERGTAVTLTLPAASRDSALTAAGMEVLRAVADRGVAVRTNVMAMNFPYAGDWRSAMTGATDAAARQLGEVWPTADPAELRRRLGVTVMIGRNDQDMVTTPEDAAAVVDHARELGLGSVGLWSVSRDTGSCPTATTARPDCSGVTQGQYAYTGVLRGFA